MSIALLELPVHYSLFLHLYGDASNCNSIPTWCPRTPLPLGNSNSIHISQSYINFVLSGVVFQNELLVVCFDSHTFDRQVGHTYRVQIKVAAMGRGGAMRHAVLRPDFLIQKESDQIGGGVLAHQLKKMDTCLGIEPENVIGDLCRTGMTAV